MCPASVAPPGASIGVFSNSSVLPELLRKALPTPTIDHAECIRIVSTTGLVNHELLDQLKQLRIVLWRVQLGMRLQEDNDVGMRKATLLKINGVKVGIHITQHPFRDLPYEGLEFGPEGMHCQVRAIIGSLAMKEGRLDLRPCRVGSHGDEEILTTIVVIDGQGILQELLHMASVARKGGRENEPCAQLIPVSISICSHCIHQALVNIHPELPLVLSDPVEAVLLSNSSGLTHTLLKEVAGEEDVIGLHI